MRCSKVEKNLAQYVDDLLSMRERRVIDRHLSDCPSCREALEDARTATEALSLLEAVRAPMSFAPRVNAAVRELAPRALAPPLLGRQAGLAFSTVAAVVVVAFVAGSNVWQSRGTNTPTRVALNAPAIAVVDAPAVAETTPVAQVVEQPKPVVRTVMAANTRTTPRRRTARRPAGTRVASAVMGREPSADAITPKELEPEPKPSTEFAGVTLSPDDLAETEPRMADASGDVSIDPSLGVVVAMARPVTTEPSADTVLVADGPPPASDIAPRASEAKTYSITDFATNEDSLDEYLGPEAT